MKKLTPNELEEGMVLAQPIIDHFGRVLLESGDTLKELYISKLKQWRITEVFVVDPKEESEETETEEPTPEEIVKKSKKVEETLEKRFAKRGANEYMKVIREAARQFLLNKVKE